MATSRAVGLLRRPGQPQQATFLELFFDVVFVFGLFRLNQWLFQNLTWSGTFRMLVLLLALWSGPALREQPTGSIRGDRRYRCWSSRPCLASW
jgi:Bacterial low temperature requirement A protein (LtrA)